MSELPKTTQILLQRRPARIGLRLRPKTWQHLLWIAGYGAGAITRDKANAKSTMAVCGAQAVDALRQAMAGEGLEP